MLDTAAAVAIIAACFAVDVFLFSIGWNIGVRPLFDAKEITIAQSLGVIVMLKVSGISLFPKRTSK